MIDAALFDMDGLLLDSERLSLEAYLATIDQYDLGQHDQLPHRKTFDLLIGANHQVHLKVLDDAFGYYVDSATFQATWEERYLSIVSAGPVPVKPGAHELLRWLDTQGIVCAVATSTNTDAAIRKLTDAGLIGYFRTLTGGDQVTNSKPAPDIYLHAGRSIDADMNRSLGFEDSPNGVRSAVAAGLDVVQVPDLIVPTEELLSLGHRVHDSLLEVRDRLATGTFQDRGQVIRDQPARSTH